MVTGNSLLHLPFNSYLSVKQVHTLYISMSSYLRYMIMLNTFCVAEELLT